MPAENKSSFTYVPGGCFPFLEDLGDFWIFGLEIVPIHYLCMRVIMPISPRRIILEPAIWTDFHGFTLSRWKP